MSSPPLTCREFAYFAVIGEGVHEEVTDILGIEPSLAWNVGDRSEHAGRIQKRMLWKKDSGLDDKEELSKHIEAIFFFLEQKRKEVRELSFRGYDSYIQCVAYYPEYSRGTHLSRDIIRQAGQLNLAIDLSFYQIDAHGHDG